MILVLRRVLWQPLLGGQPLEQVVWTDQLIGWFGVADRFLGEGRGFVRQKG